MVNGSGKPRLPQETRAIVARLGDSRANYLKRHGPAENPLLRPVDKSHPTRAHQLGDVVPAKGRASVQFRTHKSRPSHVPADLPVAAHTPPPAKEHVSSRAPYVITSRHATAGPRDFMSEDVRLFCQLMRCPEPAGRARGRGPGAAATPAPVPASQRGITRSSGSCGVSHGKMMNHSSAAVARAKMIAHASLLVTPPGRCRQSHRYMWCLPFVLLLRLECLIPGLE